MKKIFLFISAIFLFNCSQDEIAQVQHIRHSKIEQVISIKNRAERKIAYTLLNKEEKHILWKEKLDNIIASEKISGKKKIIVQNIQKKLSISLFEADSDEAEYFKTILVPQYLSDLNKEFSVKEIGLMFYSIKPIETFSVTRQENKEEFDDSEDGGTKTCDCNRNSMVSCRWLDSNSCTSISCEIPRIKPKNCGFMYSYDCNGICNI